MKLMFPIHVHGGINFWGWIIYYLQLLDYFPFLAKCGGVLSAIFTPTITVLGYRN